ncbi:MAG: phospholipid carrier-dependent glycosyltransferase [Parcubacteria group bacterium]|jgi:4-amino-4-deoxy-L-arabinose transferase-like glycosyltransferase
MTILIKEETEEEKVAKKIQKKTRWKSFLLSMFAFLLLGLPLATYFHFGFDHLSEFETADEFLWYSQGRIQQYWDAMLSRNWKDTRINDKPGVSLAIISGSARFWEKAPPPDTFDGIRKLKIFPVSEILEAHFNYRMPILLFNGIMALYFFWMIRKITSNDWAALFSSTLILLQPILLGVSQIINPDALFWSFALACLLTFLAFLETGQIFLVPLSIILLGFTLASKYVGIILFPFLLFALGVHAIFHIPDWQKESKIIWKKMLWRSLAYLLIVAGGIGTFALLMPAALVKIKYLAEGTYDFPGMQTIFRISIGIALGIILDALIFKSKILIFVARYGKYPRIIFTGLLFFAMATLVVVVGVDWTRESNLFGLLGFSFEGGKIPEFSVLPFFKQFLLESRPLIFATTPLVLGTLVFAWLASAFKQWKTNWFLVILTAFIPIFFLAVMEQKLLIHVRYSIILFPIVAIIAGVFLAEFFHWGFLRYVPKVIIFALLFSASVVYLQKAQPFYFNYTNELLPKSYSLVDGWGYGGYEAAQYLNSLPDAGKTRVIADYMGVCQFYVGPCIRYSDITRTSFRKRWNAKGYNYFVLSKKGFGRFDLNEDFPELDTFEPIWKMEIHDRPGNYLKIISSETAILKDKSEASLESGD